MKYEEIPWKVGLITIDKIIGILQNKKEVVSEISGVPINIKVGLLIIDQF